ncbi:hypothetical protein AH04_280 [Erwinia phage AH04]|uniref:Uncharacterized protein n=1 Tax=Erwinia phage AH04 TaxID=2869569 RepID=A0AAE8BQ84_9CAUD|nr:hypothetical protein PQC02_gp034 [Erwinia phage AH04]QZA70753.1 hypothetical protein AH04_280 [Erwinia phage AH04]
MSQNKPFGKIQDARVKELVENAEIHKDTHHITFKTPASLSPEKIDQMKESVTLINGWGLAVEAATNEIAHTQFPETKQESWDGRLSLFDGLTMNADARLKETIGDDTIFGGTQLFIDHPHSQDMVDWYSTFTETNIERAKKLFD